MAAQVDSAELGQYAALIEAQSQARKSVADQVAEFLRRLWASLSPQDRYNDARVAEFVAQAAQIVQQGRVATADVTDAYLSEVFSLMGVKPSTVALDITDQPRGIPLEEEMLRGVKDFRRFRSAGMDELVASERALARDLAIADYDLNMAMRDAAHQRITAPQPASPGTPKAPAERRGTLGYRRVVRPEASTSGVCGLCMAASDRVYREKPLPLHDNCKCEILPVADVDPGRLLNMDDIKAAYAAAKGNDRDSLKYVRFQVNEHGELGPVLVRKGRAFKDPAKVRKETGVPMDDQAKAAAHLRVLEPLLASTERRAAAGENVAAPLKYQREQVAKFRTIVAGK